MGLQMCWGSLRVCEVAKVECLDNMMNRRDPTLVIVPHRRMNNPPLQVNNLQGMSYEAMSSVSPTSGSVVFHGPFPRSPLRRLSVRLPAIECWHF